ncbi:uncharacterized protein LOC117167856 [Belonocnema kinseyi]|uniref:uncharacterized protein LOC117167856 n=1 Tax=Belonocnema kinseyi TaxID=2817044 RepID=UPI00143D93C2|nr:uncharacterized protein LOC117167856 [Belonocnema kinseyi]
MGHLHQTVRDPEEAQGSERGPPVRDVEQPRRLRRSVPTIPSNHPGPSISTGDGAGVGGYQDPPKRRRGRPPKPRNPSTLVPTSTDGRRTKTRGRPRRRTTGIPIAHHVCRRGPGRPRKIEGSHPQDPNRHQSRDTEEGEEGPRRSGRLRSRK